MSYFKSRTTESSNTNTNSNERNERNTFASSASIKPVVYDYKDELFPDLITSNKLSAVTKDSGVNYANAAATVIETETVVKAYEVPADKTEYTFNKTTGKTTVAYGKKSNSELERDKRLQQESEPNYIGDTILKELSCNWKRYKTEYNKIHGQDAYDNLHYLDPIYPTSDEEYSDYEKDGEYYSYYSN